MTISRSHLQSFWNLLPKPITVLAPMEDVTDLVFRDIMYRAGPPMVYMSEFISAASMLKNEKEALRRLQFNERHRPMVAQIWGNNPSDYFEAVRKLHRLGFDGIDINMGCPTRKITRKGACSALINNHSLAAELILAAQEGAESAFRDFGDAHEGPPGRLQSASPLPVSVKTRIGFHNVQTESWCSFLLNQRIDLLTIHGRTSVQQSAGEADWEEIGYAVRLRDAISKETLLIGNGDLMEYEHISEYSMRYGVDGVMIGRGALSNPFIFRDACFWKLQPQERMSWALRHLQEYQYIYDGKRNFEIMKKFFKIYLSDFSGAEFISKQIMATHEYDEAEEILRRYIAHFSTQ